MQLYSTIRKNRPLIKDSSIKAYISNIHKMQSAIDLPQNDSLDFLREHSKVISVLNTLDKITTRKNILASIVVVLKAEKFDPKLIDIYSNLMKELNTKYFKGLEDQKMTPKQKENWVDYKTIVELANAILNEVSKFKDEQSLSPQQMKLLQDLVVIRSYLLSPARNTYANMDVIESYDYNKDNKDVNSTNHLILENGIPKMFILNSYKNSAHLGTRKIMIDSDTGNIIRLWLRHNKTGNYLITATGRKMTTNYLTKYLTHIFKSHLGKNISSSMIRHIMISHDLQGEPTIKQDQQIANNIADKYQHSNFMNALYRKVQ